MATLRRVPVIDRRHPTRHDLRPATGHRLRNSERHPALMSGHEPFEQHPHLGNEKTTLTSVSRRTTGSTRDDTASDCDMITAAAPLDTLEDRAGGGGRRAGSAYGRNAQGARIGRAYGGLMTQWNIRDIPAQGGRTVIVTGGNSGLGKATAAGLAAAGARVVLAVRDTARGREAADSIRGTVEVRELDLADLSSVRRFADGWDEPIDVLVNNAGVMLQPQGTTADGFELHFGTNHLGHFALTNLLLPHVTERVVTVSSAAHRMGRIDLADLNWRNRPYKGWAVYGQSKLANLLFTLELERRLEAAGSSVRALAAHPGFAATNLAGRTGNAVADRAMSALTRVVAQTDRMGALPTLFAATEDLPGASYVGPDGFAEQRGHPTLVGRTAAASDVDMAKRLWEASEELTGVRYPAPAA